jgi:hypothetical protein
MNSPPMPKFLAIMGFLALAVVVVVMVLTGFWNQASPAVGAARASAPTRPQGQPTQPVVVGWVEYVRLSPGSALMKAKLDVGALTSSLDVRELQRFQKQGQEWVRFTYVAGARSVTVERPVVRNAQIKRHGGGSVERPVVLLTIQLGDFRQETEVNLAERQNFIYPLLLGRQFLKEARVTVDSGRTFTCRSTDYATPPP